MSDARLRAVGLARGKPSPMEDKSTGCRDRAQAPLDCLCRDAESSAPRFARPKSRNAQLRAELLKPISISSSKWRTSSKCTVDMMSSEAAEVAPLRHGVNHVSLEHRLALAKWSATRIWKRSQPRGGNGALP